MALKATRRKAPRNGRPLLWLFCAAHGRFDISEVCFAEWRWVLDELGEMGIDAHAVVVADDENLELARAAGFQALEQENKVGRKVNDAMEWACLHGDADFVVGLGSDDWVLPGYFAHLPDERTIRSGGALAVVSPDGLRLARMRVRAGWTIPWIIPRDLLAPCGYRPANDRLMYNIDGSIHAGIAKLLPDVEQDNDLFWPLVLDELQVVDFKSAELQVTPYELLRKHHTFVRETASPFRSLAARYPARLVERMRAVYALRRSELVAA